LLSDTTSSRPYITVHERNDLKDLLLSFNEFLSNQTIYGTNKDLEDALFEKDDSMELYPQLSKLADMKNLFEVACAITTNIRNQTEITPLIQRNDEEVVLEWLEYGPKCVLKGNQVKIIFNKKEKVYSDSELSIILTDLLDHINYEILNGDNNQLNPQIPLPNDVANSNPISLTQEELFSLASLYGNL
jgi:hypothetical protein